MTITISPSVHISYLDCIPQWTCLVWHHFLYFCWDTLHCCHQQLLSIPQRYFNPHISALSCPFSLSGCLNLSVFSHPLQVQFCYVPYCHKDKCLKNNLLVLSYITAIHASFQHSIMKFYHYVRMMKYECFLNSETLSLCQDDEILNYPSVHQNVN